jgi:hypothetical protein
MIKMIKNKVFARGFGWHDKQRLNRVPERISENKAGPSEVNTKKAFSTLEKHRAVDFCFGTG